MANGLLEASFVRQEGRRLARVRVRSATVLAAAVGAVLMGLGTVAWGQDIPVVAAPVQAATAGPCEAPGVRAPKRISRLDLLGSKALARSGDGPIRHFGGISGIDFDPATQTWWLLSDDKGEHAAPRAYPAMLSIDAQGITNVQIQDPVTLPLYPGEVADPEALRRHPCGAFWAWASEGDLPRGQAPSVRLLRWPEAARRIPSSDAEQAQGAAKALALGALALPLNLQLPSSGPDHRPSGPRHNRSFEGLAFTPLADALWIAMEGPLIPDGPEPDTQRGALLRFTRLSLAGGPAVQLAYPVDAIPQPATGGLRRADNGVSEILALASGELLVVERNGYEVEAGRWAFGARLYLADPEGAPDVAAVPSLMGVDVKPMRKRLLLDLKDLKDLGLDRLDNVEAAAWGPRLPDGRAVLVLVTDDNFAAHQITQLIVMAVSEDAP